MDKVIKLNTSDDMLRNVRLGKIKKVAPKRELIITKSLDKFNRLKFKDTRIKLMVYDSDKLELFKSIAEKISPQILTYLKLKGAFSDDGIKLYNGNFFVYSFDLNGVMLKSDEEILKNFYKSGRGDYE